MSHNITFTMIKPDAVEKNFIGPILDKINLAGFRIVAMKMVKLSVDEAEAFYTIHR
ncbi:MAG: nucleoside-diphosphate kinase, partial [Vicingaceae bacterium]